MSRVSTNRSLMRIGHLVAAKQNSHLSLLTPNSTFTSQAIRTLTQKNFLLNKNVI